MFSNHLLSVHIVRLKMTLVVLISQPTCSRDCPAGWSTHPCQAPRRWWWHSSWRQPGAVLTHFRREPKALNHSQRQLIFYFSIVRLLLFRFYSHLCILHLNTTGVKTEKKGHPWFSFSVFRSGKLRFVVNIQQSGPHHHRGRKRPLKKRKCE